ncbi:Ras GTPase-activating protein gap-1 [Dirofilaria immitis]|nr:Ras GTPase-activating protein gap-1 [Dirofilaria immitis]
MDMGFGPEVQKMLPIDAVVDYTGLNIREPANLYLLITLQVATRVVQSKKLNIGINRESDETLLMECDGMTFDNNQRKQRVQLRMSLWHDVLPGFNSYFQGQICITVNDDIVQKQSADPQCKSSVVDRPFIIGTLLNNSKKPFDLLHIYVVAPRGTEYGQGVFI